MILRRAVKLMLATLVVSSGLSACSDRAEPMNPVDDGDDMSTVTLRNFAFGPATITVDRGATVRWRNGTSTFHTVTPDEAGAFEEWQTNAQGQTFEVRFDEPGTYRYHCEPHAVLGMTGVIEVR